MAARATGGSELGDWAAASALDCAVQMPQMINFKRSWQRDERDLHLSPAVTNQVPVNKFHIQTCAN